MYRPAVLLACVLTATAYGQDPFDPTKPDALKPGTPVKLSGKYTVHGVNPTKKFAKNAHIMVDGKRADPNFFNGTIRLTDDGRKTVVILLKTDTEGRKDGDEIELNLTAAVTKHTRTVQQTTTDGKGFTGEQTVYLLTPKK